MSYDVSGVDLDGETRCAHYGSDPDIVALRFGCCGAYYACHECHRVLTNHRAEPWPTERRNEPSVLCGACGSTMTAGVYTSVDACPTCDSPFNPGCAAHYDRYFEWMTGDVAVDGPTR